MSDSRFINQLQQDVKNYIARNTGDSNRIISVQDIIGSSLARVKPAASPNTNVIVPGNPPTPTGFEAVAESSYIIINHDNPGYTLASGHAKTIVYAIKASENPNPTFNDAQEIAQFTGNTYLLPVDIGVTYHLWIKWKGNNNNLSLSPAGGDTGLVVVTSKLTPDLIDTKGLDIKNSGGDTVFAPSGQIASNAFLNLNGNNILLSDIASGSLVPSLSYVGEFTYPPTEADLLGNWKQNAVYKNPLDGKSYVLTGNPLAWQEYLIDGQSFTLNIESSNGIIFRVGQNINTTLKARLFKNGAEVTNETPESWFYWRRVSANPPQPPNDDESWNRLYAGGYKQVTINVDDVFARATFFCDVISNF